MEQWCWVVSVWADRYHYLESSLNSYVSMDKKSNEWTWVSDREVGLYQPHGLQHARLPCPPLSPRACSNSYPLSRWYHPTISSSVIPLSSCLQSFPSSWSFQMNQLFPSGRWPQYWTFSFNISPSNENTQHWSPLGWTGWIFLQSKGLSRVFSNTTVQKHQFFGTQLSL